MLNNTIREIKENYKAVDVYNIGAKVVDLDQNTFIDEETGYEIYVTEDGHWIAEDEAINQWVQVK